MKDYSEVTLGELQDEYEDMLYPFICDGDYNGVYNGVSDECQFVIKDDTQESCWIEWPGGYCPVPRGTLVDVIYRDGETIYGLPANEINDTKRDASVCFWRHDGMPNDIVRYRKAVHQ